MIGGKDSPDDVSMMMEELWGPRAEGPVGAVTGPRDRIAAVDEPPEQIAVPESDDQAHPAVAGLVEMVEARQAETIERARSELEALRSDIDAALAHLVAEVAGAREEAVAAADARVAGAETRLLSRLDAISAGVAQVAQGSAVGHDVLARLEVVERETTERWAAIEQRVGPEPQSVTQADEGLKAESVSSADLDTLGTEGARVDVLAQQVAEAITGVASLSSSVDSALGRVERLEEEMARPATSPEPDRFDPAELRSQLESHVALMLQAGRTEMERSFTEAVGQLAERMAAEQSELQAALGAAVDRADRAGSDVARMKDDLSELEDYHAALDHGLGALRTEIGELRDAMRKMARDQGELLDRAEAPTQMAPTSTADQGRGRRTGRRVETGGQIATVLSVTEGLVGEHSQMKSDLARLEQEVRATASATPALAPLRSDVRRLRDQIAQQNEALEALRVVVESIPKRAPNRSPAAKRTARPSKD